MHPAPQQIRITHDLRGSYVEVASVRVFGPADVGACEAEAVRLVEANRRACEA
jgi:hypothetical protein